MRTTTTLRRRLLTEAILLAIFIQAAETLAAAGRERENGNSAVEQAQQVQRFVDELEARLSISQEIVVAIVPKNPLIVSIQRLGDRHDVFQLSIEDGFLDGLTDDDLRAVVAHELGHLWIFTHHPYLQTEELANQIALRLVSRDELTVMYGKLWERTGVKGHLTYLGPDATPKQTSHGDSTSPH